MFSSYFIDEHISELCSTRLIKAIYLLKVLAVPEDITICLCDDYCSGQKEGKKKAHYSSLVCRLQKGVNTFGDKGAVTNHVCMYVSVGFKAPALMTFCTSSRRVHYPH